MATVPLGLFGFQIEGVLYPGNGNLIAVNGLVNLLTGAFVNDATLNFSLYDANGVLVPGCSGVQMVYTAGSNGDYVGKFGVGFNPPVGSGYTLVVDGDEGGGYGSGGYGSGGYGGSSAGHIHLELLMQVQTRQT